MRIRLRFAVTAMTADIRSVTDRRVSSSLPVFTSATMSGGNNLVRHILYISLACGYSILQIL